MTMSLEKIRLFDRVNTLLQGDRHALRCAQRRPLAPPLLLALVPGRGRYARMLDVHLPELAEGAGLRYLRLCPADLKQLEVPRRSLDDASYVLADLSGRDEGVITMLYQALGGGRRILVAARTPADIPPDLAELPTLLYDPKDPIDLLFRLQSWTTQRRAV